MSPAEGPGAFAPHHGGPDAAGAAPHDFSTNSNACGPCPQALQAVEAADASRYPDPAYTALREMLAAFHGVAADRILPAASASEFIHRVTALAVRLGRQTVALPRHGYGDYLRAAQAWGLQVQHVPQGMEDSHLASLEWACEPSSPSGLADPALASWHAQCARSDALRVLDCAYVPLCLEGQAGPLSPHVWQLWTPNKALGMTGVRAAYAIAPPQEPPQRLAALRLLAPSWPLGAHGVAMLSAWTRPDVQRWLQSSLATLRGWKHAQLALCHSLGWEVLAGSMANYFVARLPVPDVPLALHALRLRGIKLRDCTSFGLPGHVRLGVLPPPSQQALRQAWQEGVAGAEVSPAANMPG